ncbi:S49 family peptidase [Arenicella sp. 4NH20-0111]|uniref:S49 family peptidase n=1 Tax=Arenicella sp. 4NH20-0111 TaxID=3127648 RepID=UPI00310C3406
MFGKKKDNGALPGSNRVPVTSNEVMQQLAIDYMKDRKWRRIFKFAVLGLIIIYFISVAKMASKEAGFAGASAPHTALVELNGVIGIGGGIAADQANQSIRKAFEARNSKGVVLRINSPGGSPVQSDEINSEISRLKQLYPSKPVHVVVSDVCASGGYYIAAAADNIYANPSSIVGSIGVRMDSFGFVDAMQKLGVERRSLTAGENKSILDPFLPTKPSQEAHAREMLGVVHQEFINVVKDGRGDRLTDNPDLFSGLFWSGRQAKDLGLIDDFGGLNHVAANVIGEDRIVDYTYRPDFFEQFSKDLGVSIATTLGALFTSSMTLE